MPVAASSETDTVLFLPPLEVDSGGAATLRPCSVEGYSFSAGNPPPPPLETPPPPYFPFLRRQSPVSLPSASARCHPVFVRQTRTAALSFRTFPTRCSLPFPTPATRDSFSNCRSRRSSGHVQLGSMGRFCMRPPYAPSRCVHPFYRTTRPTQPHEVLLPVFYRFAFFFSGSIPKMGLLPVIPEYACTLFPSGALTATLLAEYFLHGFLCKSRITTI